MYRWALWTSLWLTALGCRSDKPRGGPTADTWLAFGDGGGRDLPAMVDDTAPPLLGVPCQQAGYAGWQCDALDFYHATHDTTFPIALRWNLAETVPAATVVWLPGNQGEGQFRSRLNAETVQDRLAQLDGIRSVEVEFSGADGYWGPPALGYPAAGGLYAAVLLELKRRGLVRGGWTTHFGSSNGTMLGAAALAHHGLIQQVQRVVFDSGPFLADMAPECTDPAHWLYIGPVEARRLIDSWNGWADRGVCENGLSDPEPGYDLRSLLGTGAEHAYPQLSVNVLLGELEEFTSWLLRSNRNWYQQISAEQKTRHIIAGVGHGVMGVADRPTGARTQHAIDLVYQYLRLRPGQQLGPKPQLTFSDSAQKAEDGASVERFALEQTIYGSVRNIGPMAQGCAEAVPAMRGHCEELSNWTTMPAAPWSYDPQSERWRSSFTAAELGLQPGRFDSWWRDTATDEHTDRVTIVIE